MGKEEKMITNLDQLNVSQKNIWAAFANKLETLGYNLKVFSGRKGAAVFNKHSGAEVGTVSRDMLDDEEMDYILYNRLQLKRDRDI
jgi:hypothetical protein